jgi:hypothetical protein
LAFLGNGFSGTGFSDNGVSGTGFSDNGFSGTAFSGIVRRVCQIFYIFKKLENPLSAVPLFPSPHLPNFA